MCSAYDPDASTFAPAELTFEETFTMRFMSITLLLLLMGACKKEDAKDTCFYSPAPRVTYNSWPSGLSTDSALNVTRSNIPLDYLVVADASGDQPDVLLNSVNVRLLANANDSVLYANDVSPNTASYTSNTEAALDSITADIPATLRISGTNKCGFSDVVVRQLLVTPD